MSACLFDGVCEIATIMQIYENLKREIVLATYLLHANDRDWPLFRVKVSK